MEIILEIKIPQKDKISNIQFYLSTKRQNIYF